jgi:beta-lactamase class A
MTATPDFLRANAEAEIRRIAAYCQGELGIAARHLGTGAELSVQGDVPFPMASTIKMTLVLTILDLSRRGRLAMTEMVTIEPGEMTPLGPLGGEFPHGGIALSVLNLLQATVTRSDNTATDVLFRIAGGTAAVQAHMHAIGLYDISVKRTMREALCVMHEIPLPLPGISMRDALRDLPPDQHNARSRASGPDTDYGHPNRDHATPQAMLALLARLWASEGIEPAARNTVLAMMARTSTGATRIRARLPAGIGVAHKTGSGTGTANDLGFLTLPEGRGTVALVAYVKGSPLPVEARDAVLADAARLVLDYFLLTTPAG